MNYLLNKIYILSFLLIVFGGIQWGLVGIGALLNKNFNLINHLSRGNIYAEYGLYILIGVFSIMYVWLSTKNFEN